MKQYNMNNIGKFKPAQETLEARTGLRSKGRSADVAINREDRARVVAGAIVLGSSHRRKIEVLDLVEQLDTRPLRKP